MSQPTPSADWLELRTCMDLLLRQCRRSVSLKDVPDDLCAIDRQTIRRAEKALEKVK